MKPSVIIKTMADMIGRVCCVHVGSWEWAGMLVQTYPVTPAEEASFDGLPAVLATVHGRECPSVWQQPPYTGHGNPWVTPHTVPWTQGMGGTVGMPVWSVVWDTRGIPGIQRVSGVHVNCDDKLGHEWRGHTLCT